MKQIYAIISLILTGFTFVLIFSIALFNNAGIYVSFLRGVFSAGFMLVLSWILIFLLINNISIKLIKIKQQLEKAENEAVEEKTADKNQDFTLGYEQILSKNMEE